MKKAPTHSVTLLVVSIVVSSCRGRADRDSQAQAGPSVREVPRYNRSALCVRPAAELLFSLNSIDYSLNISRLQSTWIIQGHRCRRIKQLRFACF